jgi:hypothetical protein
MDSGGLPATEDDVIYGDLGRKTIRGIEVRGLRTTTTDLTGEVEHGIGKPTETRFNAWFDANSGMSFLMVLSSIDGPHGILKKELVSMKLREPDPLFSSPRSTTRL